MKGAATFIFTIILLVLSTLIILFAANSGMMTNKTTANFNRNAQAFLAAEAGVEFGINYLQKNSSTILASPSGGYISAYSDGNTTNVTLANNSKFTVVYTNPIANNYNLILITSTGTSDDGSSTRVVKQQVQFGSILVNAPTNTVTTKGSVSISGSGEISNTSSSTTIQAASSVSLSGNAKTELSSGTSSTPGNIKSDIQANNSTLANMSQNDFFASYFGTTNTTTVQNNMAYYYSNSSNTNYSNTLNGKTGTTIWITQTNGSTASINGNTVIGTATNPVLLIVNGSLSISGNVTFYGFIFILGTTGISSVTGSLEIIGGIASSDNLNISGTSDIQYNASVLNKLKQNSGSSYFAKVLGAWKDF